MAKIGYAPKVENVKTSPLWDGSSIGNKFIVTGDGYLMVKDKLFRIPLTTSDNTDNIYNLTVSNTDGALAIGVGGFTHDAVSVVIGSANGILTEASVDKGLLKVDHTKPTTATSTVGPSAASSTTISVPQLSFDDYGHIVSTATRTATLDTVKQSVLTDDNTYYILAGKGESGQAYWHQNITIDKLGYLHANKLYVGNTDVETLIHASNAMYYEGSVNSESDLPASPNNGDTYIVETAGTYKGIECEVGDYLIASVKGSGSAATVTWTVIQGNIKGAITTGADATNLTTNGILYATGNKTVATTAVGVTGQYLSGTEWKDFQTLTLTNGSSSVKYNPYSGYTGNQPTITLAGSGVGIDISGSTITLSAKNDNTTYDLFAGPSSATTNASSSDNAYLHLLGSDKSDDLIQFIGSGATTITALAPDSTNNYGRIKISSTDTTYTHNTIKFYQGNENIFSYLGGQNSTEAAANKSIYSGGKTTFAVTNGNLTISSSWRDVKIPYIKTAATTSTSAVLDTTAIDSALIFSDDFLLEDGKVELAWAEVDSNGIITYG